MALAPGDSAIDADALPEATAVPFTFITAAASVAVGVTVIELTEVATVAA